MSTQLTGRDKLLLLVLAGVLLLFAVYMTVCKRYDARRDTARAQLAELTPQLQQLREYEANQAVYEAKTTKLRDEIGTEMERFPSDIRSEHILLNAKTLQDALGISIQSIGADPATLLSSFQLPLKNGQSYKMQNVYAFTTSEAFNCTLRYEQFLSLLDFIYAQKERTALKSISVTYNSAEGNLSGSAVLTKYFIVPENYVYERLWPDGITQGVTNPFGTSKTVKGSSGSSGKSGTAAGSGSGTTVKTSGGVTEIRPSADSGQ